MNFVMLSSSVCHSTLSCLCVVDEADERAVHHYFDEYHEDEEHH